MDRVWWKQITKASTFCQKVIDALSSEDSIILNLPVHVPWYSTLTDIINDALRDNGIPKIIHYVENDVKPGEYLLESFCKKEIRMTYRIGKTHAAFLAEQESSTLNSSIVWVRLITPDSLAAWLDFIREYYRVLPASRQRGLFILENRGDIIAGGGKHIQSISFSSEISAYDKYTFCTLISSTAQVNSSIRPYLAELVSTVCSDDIELCAKCVGDGLNFAKDPEGYLETVSKTEFRSDGSLFDAELSQEELRYRVWESQIRMIFPLIERFRMQFIKNHRNEIQRQLPIENNYGDRIEKPEDAEIGLIYYLASVGGITMKDPTEAAKLKMLKDARNELAHLNMLPLEIVTEILAN